jgi:hypothetical protein
MKKKKMFCLMLLFMVLGAASMNAQVTIGSTSNPDPSAILDLNTGSNVYKGLLLPNVPLTGDNDETTITNPATGLLIYNTGAAGLTPAGLYCWNGTKWEAAGAGNSERESGYSILTLPAALSFTSLPYGYAQPEAETVVIYNTGVLATGALTLGGTASTNYTLNPASSIESINRDASGQFTVQPNTGLNAGTYSAAITVSNADVPAKTVNVSFTVNKAGQTITGLSVPPKTVGDDPFDLSATATSGLELTYTSSNTDVATVSGSTVTIIGIGESTITANQAGNANYDAAPEASVVLTVSSGIDDQTISDLVDLQKTYGDDPFDLSATASSGLGITYTSGNTGVATISGSRVTIVGAGESAITANQAGNASFNPAPQVSATLTVNKAEQTITGLSGISKSVQAIPFALSATASSGLEVSYTSSKPAVATISGNTVTIIGIGSSTITAKQAGNANYNAAPDKTATLTVSKVSQTITASTTALSKTLGDVPFSWTGTASSELTVTYSSSDATVATINSYGLVTIAGAGVCELRADQAGDATYSAAPQKTVQLSVAGAGTGNMGANTYNILCLPNHLGCWTENSREGSPKYTQYTDQEVGERGYYYRRSEVSQACSGGFVIPTQQQWFDLRDNLKTVGLGADAFFRTAAKAGVWTLSGGFKSWDERSEWWDSDYSSTIATDGQDIYPNSGVKYSDDSGARSARCRKPN